MAVAEKSTLQHWLDPLYKLILYDIYESFWTLTMPMTPLLSFFAE